MKNKNTILIEIATQSAGKIFSMLYWPEGRVEGFCLEKVQHHIEDECMQQISSIFLPEDKITERDIFMCKMYATQYYNEHMAKILNHKVSHDGAHNA